MATLLMWQPLSVGFDLGLAWQSVEHAARVSPPLVSAGGVVRSAADDAELIDLVARGDHGAYRELIDRHLRGMHVFVYRMLGNRAEAEEVCQECFLRLWKQAGSYVARAKPSTWLYRIAHNLAVDRLRRRREGQPPLGMGIDELPDSGRPSLHLHQKQVAEAVERALGELPPRQRAAISLVHYQGMSSAEAAQVLGIRLRALESLLARGRQKLREQLAAFQSEERREE